MLRKSLLLGLSLSSLTVFGQGVDPAQVLTDGLKANESLIDFIEPRSCKMGIINQCNKPLNAKEIQKLKSLILNLDVWKEEAFEKLLPEMNVLGDTRVSLKRGTRFSIKTQNVLSNKFLEISYNPEDPKAIEFTQKVKVATVTRLVLLDNFLRLTNTLNKATKIRSILLSDLHAEGRIIKDFYELAMNEKTWKETQRGVDFLKKAQKFNSTQKRGLTDSYYTQYLENSYTGKRMKEKDMLVRLKASFIFNNSSNEARFFEHMDDAVFNISKDFGNAAGKFQSRDGKLKALARNPESMKKLKAKLKPMDILFEKTPFRLTDKFIPGYYGHVAIWLGTPQELMGMKINYKGKMIPLLDHPTILPYLEKMSRGQLVVEALREPGVTMNTLEHFMDIDDFLAIESTQNEDKAELILRTIQQVGKPYDFNFDVETESEIVCSELIYAVFKNIEWPLDKTMGRFTISPDHVALKSLDNCFSPTVMFVDGKEIENNKAAELKRVLKEAGVSYKPSGTCR